MHYKQNNISCTTICWIYNCHPYIFGCYLWSLDIYLENVHLESGTNKRSDFCVINYNKEQMLLFTIWSDRPVSTDMCHVSEVCSFSPSHLKQTEGPWLQQGWSPPLPASLSAVWRCKSQPNNPESLWNVVWHKRGGKWSHD